MEKIKSQISSPLEFFFITFLFCIILLVIMSPIAHSSDYTKKTSNNFANNYAEKCMDELKSSGIYTNNMTFLGSKSAVFDDFMLIGITTVFEGSGDDKYSVLSCKIDQSQGIMVSGPMHISKNRAHFTR